MRNIFLLMTLFTFYATMAQQRFHRRLPAGNYSGICPLGGDRYAVVCDKTAEDGFYVFRLTIDTSRVRITSAANLGFRSSGLPNRDGEGICYCPTAGTVFISGEADNQVFESTLEGQRTGRRLAMPPEYATARPNLGLESLTYDPAAHLFYTTTERPLPGDTMLHIQSFGDDLQPRQQYLYQPDAPISSKHYHGVADLLATGDGRLLVLERQLRIPRLKIGATATVRIYEVRPREETGIMESHKTDDMLLEKHLVADFTTRQSLFRWRFANYEGMCQPAPGLLLLVADSQGRYKSLVRDWFLLMRL